MLFDPITIRGTIIRNRVVVPPMVVTKSDEHGCVTDFERQHYRKFAEGGAGLIIQEATCINDSGKLCDTQLGVWNDGQIEGLRSIVEIAHKNGAAIVLQIHHAGVKSTGNKLDVPFDFDIEMHGRRVCGKAMSLETARRIHDEFVEAGRRAYEAGYDGVELHGAHGYLISQLLNPVVNIRDDSLGTDPQGYVRSIMEEIRKVTDDEFIIGIRLGGLEPNLKDGLNSVRKLRGAADYFHVSYGYSTDETEAARIKAAGFPYEYTIYAAKEIKRMLKEEFGDDTPVIAVSGINSPAMAEDILQRYGVDMVSIGRGHLINPNWAEDAAAGLETGKCLKCKKCMWKWGKCPGIAVRKKKSKDKD